MAEVRHNGCPRCGITMHRIWNSDDFICQVCGYRLTFGENAASAKIRRIADALEVRHERRRGDRIELREGSIPIYDGNHVLAAFARFPMFRFTSREQRRQVAEAVAERAVELGVGIENITQNDGPHGIGEVAKEGIANVTEARAMLGLEEPEDNGDELFDMSLTRTVTSANQVASSAMRNFREAVDRYAKHLGIPEEEPQKKTDTVLARLEGKRKIRLAK